MKNSLNLFIDSEDVIRCRSRIAEANQLAFNEKCPKLLRNDSKFTKLVALKYHHDVYHCGVQATLSNLQNNYWIVQGRQKVKSILTNCVVCKIIQEEPLALQETPALPSYRVNCIYAFENTVLNFARPLYCKGDYSSSGEMYRCYVLHFTCCVTRAVHLKLTTNVNSNSMILLALHRFISRRGIPRSFISNNFKTFKSVDVKRFCNTKEIVWKFILERSPWWGGFYERLISIVKSSLKKVLWKAYLSYLELYTVLTEIENVLNSRPLTYLSDETFCESLTPFHMIYGKSFNGRCEIDINDRVKDDDLRIRAKYTEMVLQHFYNRFYKEYMLAFLERHSLQTKRNSNNQAKLRIGEIAIIKDDKPRPLWRKGN